MHECGGRGECVNTLKGGGTEERGGKEKILKGGASLVKGWVPWKGGTGTPLQTMIWIGIIIL